MRKAGANVAIDRRAEDVAAWVLALTGGIGVDRIVEVAFEENLATSLAVLKPNAVIATYASGMARSALAVPFYKALMQGLTVHFVYVYLMPEAAHDDAARDIGAALRAGALHPRLGRRFGLADMAAAHVAQDDGSAGGKLLIDVIEE